ncbi:hypothetical protein MW887_001626 [Aspergillus wentii]|nr:hypothetical protein MW887_001626 [Aspergillus wentii]
MPYSSSGRRRASSEPDCYSLSDAPSSPSAVSITSFQEARLREQEDLGRYSPRSAVARRLGELAIRGDHFSNYESPSGHSQEPGQTKCWLGPYSGFHNMSGPLSVAESDPNQSGTHDSSAKTQPENKPQTTPTPSPKKQSVSSPRRKRNPIATSKARNQRRSSPPLAASATENPLTWHDSEITGHNPTDPTDDGYGINGVGFKPTAAMAWARSQRRQRQVADWKSREARDARERRRERRDGHETDKMRTIQNGAIQKRVKFES